MITKREIIPIAKPMIEEEEIKAVEKVLKSGTLSQGPKVKEFEEEFAEYIGVDYAIATNSGTSALDTALASLGIRRGDEVITTTFSFVSTASCVSMQGAKPVFCDIDQKTYNINPDEIEKRINDRTKAVIVVHLYGQPCDMRRMMEICEDHNLALIEDACQAHGAEYRGQSVGSFGVGCFSFYPTKNMTTGEGGMITTNDEEVAKMARMIRDHGQKKRYLHAMLGYNYRMTDIAAAIGLVQLKRLDQFNEQRVSNAMYYNGKLDNESIQKPFIAENVRHVFHQYTIRVKERDRFLKHLKINGVGYGIYYQIPLHKQPMFSEYNKLTLPEAERACKEVVSIPVHPALDKEKLKYIAGVVNAYE
ncbi:MAG: DegT/DnrJ/EryC1/StrS family aminotransferase [Halobacteriota archaeon]